MPNAAAWGVESTAISLLLAALMLVGVLSVPSRAHACSYAACAPAELAPPNGATVPANVLGFPMQPMRDGTVSAVPTDDAVLLAADGSAIPSTTTTVTYDLVATRGSRDDIYALRDRYDAEKSQRLVVPAQTLVPGTYTLSLSRDCLAGSPTTTTRTFAVTDAATLPTTAGTISVAVDYRSRYAVRTNLGSCGREVEASVATVTLTPTPALAAFQSVARIEVVVDGIRPWPPESVSIDGGIIEAQSSWLVSRWGEALGPTWGTELHTACGSASSDFDDMGLVEGEHSGRLLVWLAGEQKPLPAVPFSFRTACSAADAQVLSSVDAGADASQAGPAARPSQSSGCSISPSSSRPSPIYVVAALVGILLVRLRRRSVGASSALCP